MVLDPSYDPVLVVLSLLVAFAASAVALDLTATLAAEHARPRRLHLLTGSVAMGFGIWSMHFVGMLSMSLPVPVSYDTVLVLDSLAFAVVASWLALVVASRPNLSSAEHGAASVVMALAIVGMHYIGMTALDTEAVLTYAPLLVTASAAIALAASFGAIGWAYRLRREAAHHMSPSRVGAALVMGGAISGMHYAGMAAARFSVPAGVGLPASASVSAEAGGLAFAVAGAAAVVLALSALGSILGSRGEHRRVAYLTLVMTVVAVLVGSVSISMLYRVNVEVNRAGLRAMVTSQARLLEAVARLDSGSLHGIGSGDGLEAALARVRAAHRGVKGFGRTGEFVLARREGNRIAFLPERRESVPFDAVYAEPVRRAIRGESGTVIAPDYRGVQVLAAYEHVGALDLALVAKVDMAEIRAPFIRTGIAAGGATVVLVLIGSLLFLRLSDPLVAQAEEGAFIDSVLVSLPQAVIIEDEHGRIIRANPGFTVLTGVPPAEAVGIDAAEVLVPEDRVPFAEFRRRVRQGMVASDEFSGRHRDGRTFRVRLSGARAQGLEAATYVLAGEDVTLIEQARDAARRAETQYRDLVETASDLVFEVDVEGRWSFLNEACREIYGGSPEELVGTFVRERMDDGQWAVDGPTLQSVLQGRDVVDHETLHRDLHGRTRHLSFSASPIFGPDGSVTGCRGTARDVTARVEARQALADLVRQHSLLRSLINNTPDLIFYKDEAGVYRGCNYAFEDFVGRAESEIIGLTDFDLFPPERARAFVDSDRRMFETGEPVKSEEWVRYPDGHRALLDTLKMPFSGPDGERLGLIGISRDLTERKLIEEQVQKMAAEAAKANKMKSAFLANMSHEIRTPMNGVMGMTELLLATDLTPQQEQSARLIQSSAEALLSILDDILDFSKIEAGQLELEDIPFDLWRTVDVGARVLAVRAAGRETELLIDIRPEVPRWVQGDPVRLRQVITNLTSNAVKFTQDGEVVVVVELVERTGDQARVRFSVRDTGIGIPQEKLETIFEEFQQADSSTTRHYGGTGLGLAISRRIVGLMGGDLIVESEDGKGSEFHFTVPMEVAETQEEGPETSVNLEGRQILVVDDNRLNRHIIRGFLESVEADVEEVESAMEGLAALRSACEGGRPFDIVVVDFLMPDIDGFGLTERIKADAMLRGTPIMMLTSAGRPEDQRRAEELGVHTYLTKPIARVDLLRAVGELVSPVVPSAPMSSKAPAPTVRSARILLAEDNAVNQHVATSLLEKRGHRVVVVEDGSRALEALERESFDVVLMDIQMPVMDGLTATREIRARGMADLPILALTAHALGKERERCIEAGMNGFLSKPFRPEELYAQVEAFAAEGRRRRPEEAPEKSPRIPARSHSEAPVRIDRFRELMREAGAEEIVDETLMIYRGEAPERIARIREAVTRRDPEELEAVSHALRSASLNIWAVDLAELLEHVENAAAEGDVSKGEELMEPIVNEFDRVLEYLNEVQPER